MTLLPVAPLLILPFALIFFVAVFPVWLVAMIVLLALRAIIHLVVRDPSHSMRTWVDKAFQWVKSFGGLIHMEANQQK